MAAGPAGARASVPRVAAGPAGARASVPPMPAGSPGGNPVDLAGRGRHPAGGEGPSSGAGRYRVPPPYQGAPRGGPPVAPYRGPGYPGEPSGFAEPLEPSLTGHILAQGRPDTGMAPARTTRIMITMMIVLGVLVLGGLAAAIFAGDQLTSLFGSFFKSN